MKKENKGITLIALVVTIVVLLILAGTSIAMLAGDNGIIKKSQEAKRETEKSAYIEEKILAVNEAHTNLSNIIYTDSDGVTITIPAGYAPIRTEKNKVKDGLVIVDLNANEWVWVPVSEEQLEDMFVMSETEHTLLVGGTSTKNYSKIHNYDEANINERDINEYVPGSKLSAEPERIRNEDPSDMVDRYNKMLNSIKTYHGFFVGRYELGKDENDKVVIQKGSNPWGNTWYTLYEACENINVNKKSSTTEMIWGCEWDRMCAWLQNEEDSQGKTYDIFNSPWGNHVYFTENGNYVTSDYREAIKLWGEEGLISHRVFPDFMPTGYSENWKSKNIYDLSGNVWEWTQLAYGTGQRVCRGGAKGYYSATGVWDDYNLDPRHDGGQQYGTRCTMYINVN